MRRLTELQKTIEFTGAPDTDITYTATYSKNEGVLHISSSNAEMVPKDSKLSKSVMMDILMRAQFIVDKPNNPSAIKSIDIRAEEGCVKIRKQYIDSKQIINIQYDTTIDGEHTEFSMTLDGDAMESLWMGFSNIIC